MKTRTIEIDPLAGARLVEHNLTLRGLQEAVGGYIELVRVRVAGEPNLRLVIDEAGKLRGKIPNREATAIADLRFGDFIVGRAIVIRLDDNNEIMPTGAGELAAIETAIHESEK